MSFFNNDPAMQIDDWDLVDDDILADDNELLFDYERTTTEPQVHRNKHVKTYSGSEADNDDDDDTDSFAASEATVTGTELSNSTVLRQINEAWGCQDREATMTETDTVTNSVIYRRVNCAWGKEDTDAAPTAAATATTSGTDTTTSSNLKQRRDLNPTVSVGSQTLMRYERVRSEDMERREIVGAIWQSLWGNMCGVALDLGRIVEVSLPSCLNGDAEESRVY
ncbi:hypothetical protein BDV96DRAFT_34482 [Lophiotrema nucula]|uniref:Uncharacterized protein n=1 Tax=Lophiotrema nucula TaxID=690887 RepID=A0A6A5ZCU9_9PLEO|nr:hypothetical protein BDV96DRAFT_34482 [Lophiotrema nucula]